MEELEQEEFDKELLNVGPSASDELPEVPNDEVKEKAKAKKKGKNFLFITNLTDFHFHIHFYSTTSGRCCR